MAQGERDRRVVAIVQARLGSSRLPGKVLLPIAGRPMLSWVMRRLQLCRSLDGAVVATSKLPGDDRLAGYCSRQEWPLFRGSEKNVLARFLGAAQQASADYVVRITADCPFVDPSVIDQIVSLCLADDDCDYCSNFWPVRWMPRGLDCEIVRYSALRSVKTLAKACERYREHVTLAIYEQSKRFRLAQFPVAADRSNFRWTVDTHDDLQLVNAIANWFGHDRFDWNQIVDAYPQNPHWLRINEHVAQKVA